MPTHTGAAPQRSNAKPAPRNPPPEPTPLGLLALGPQAAQDARVSSNVLPRPGLKLLLRHPRGRLRAELRRAGGKTGSRAPGTRGAAIPTPVLRQACRVRQGWAPGGTCAPPSWPQRKPSCPLRRLFTASRSHPPQLQQLREHARRGRRKHLPGGNGPPAGHQRWPHLGMPPLGWP